MDHTSDWMLPGAALVLLVIAGIVLVALDDIVMALSRSRRKGGIQRPPVPAMKRSATGSELAQKDCVVSIRPQ